MMNRLVKGTTVWHSLYKNLGPERPIRRMGVPSASVRWAALSASPNGRMADSLINGRFSMGLKEVWQRRVRKIC